MALAQRLLAPGRDAAALPSEEAGGLGPGQFNEADVQVGCGRVGVGCECGMWEQELGVEWGSGMCVLELRGWAGEDVVRSAER